MPRSEKHSQSVGRAVPQLRGKHGSDGRVWKRLTLLGNAAFTGGRWADAELLYDRALIEAERLFAAARVGEKMRGCEPAPLLVAATANAAENWLKLGDGARAGDVLVLLCRTLCDTIGDESAPVAFREQCFVHLRVATIELLALLPRAGWAEDAVARQVAGAKAVALRFVEHLCPKH